jgi:hypothetical protein
MCDRLYQPFFKTKIIFDTCIINCQQYIDFDYSVKYMMSRQIYYISCVFSSGSSKTSLKIPEG